MSKIYQFVRDSICFNVILYLKVYSIYEGFYYVFSKDFFQKNAIKL